MSSQKLYSVSQLYGRRIKPTNERFGQWLLMENMDNLITNIGCIDYTENEGLLASKESRTFYPITEPFCDNIMLIKICSLQDCDNDSKTPIVKKEICGSFNSYIRGKFDKFVSARHGVKAKLPFFLESENRMAKGITSIIGKECMDKIYKKYVNPVCIPYKVELADVKLEILMEDLQNILIQLNMEDYYLMDLDITQDFAGIFNKMEMCDYLTQNFNFCHQGEYTDDCNVIVDNDNTVGRDCLTWLTSNARVKIYNKFICQLTSPGVNKRIGNHIIDFLHCPDTRLRETFSNNYAKEHGVTRLEATIYNYNINFHSHNDITIYDPLNDCLSLLECSKVYFDKAPIYSVSFEKMWIKLTSNLQNSCCFVFNNLLQYVYWGNKQTKKLTGLQLTLPANSKNREKIIKYVISAFSFNCLPINYIEAVENFEDKDKIHIIQKCYIKSGQTYFTRTGTPFSVIPEDIDIEKAALVATNNVNPQVLRKRVNINNRLLPYTVKEIEPIFLINILSTKKRQQEIEEINLKRRKMEYQEKTLAIKDEYRMLLKKENEFAEFKNKICKYFRSYWKNLDTTGVYNVSAFTVKCKENYSYVGILAENQESKNVYYLKGIHKNIFIEAFAKKEQLKKDGYIILNDSGMDIISTSLDKPFLTFKTNGLTNYNGHSFAKIEEMEFLTDVWDNIKDALPAALTQKEMNQFSDIAMQDIIGNVNIRDCKRLEELPEGAELLIKCIKEIDHRNKLRFILKFENVDTLYLSNYWFEKEMEEKKLDLNYNIKIKLDKLKHNPSRHKERVVFCV